MTYFAHLTIDREEEAKQLENLRALAGGVEPGGVGMAEVPDYDPVKAKQYQKKWKEYTDAFEDRMDEWAELNAKRK